MVDFNLDFYTEVQDLSYLENSLSTSLLPQFTALNMAMISLVEDYSLVGFETLAVEVRRYIDKPLTLYSRHTRTKTRCFILLEPLIRQRVTCSCLQQALSGHQTRLTRAVQLQQFDQTHMPCFQALLDVQERWVDSREEWDAYEKEGWRKEGEMVRDLAT